MIWPTNRGVCQPLQNRWICHAAYSTFYIDSIKSRIENLNGVGKVTLHAMLAFLIVDRKQSSKHGKQENF